MVLMYFPGGVEREVEGNEPLILEVETVCFYNRHTKEMKGSQVRKAQLFLEYDCIHYLGNNLFVCLPLNTQEEITYEQRVLRKKPYTKDYNSSEYLITKEEGTFTCNCQGFVTRARKGELIPNGANCSHTLSLYYYFSLKKFMKPRQLTLSEAVA